MGIVNDKNYWKLPLIMIYISLVPCSFFLITPAVISAILVTMRVAHLAPSFSASEPPSLGLSSPSPQPSFSTVSPQVMPFPTYASPSKSQLQAFCSLKSILFFDCYLISFLLVSTSSLATISFITSLPLHLTERLWPMVIVFPLRTPQILGLSVILIWQRLSLGKSNSVSILCLYPSDSM